MALELTPYCINPNVAYPRRGKTRQGVPDVAARRLGENEAYVTVREILAEASTVADGALSRERSGFYRCGFATLGLTTEGLWYGLT
jgi:hypothetical protein